MTWITKLCETYDNCSANVFKAKSSNDLLPIGHIIQNARIEITLDENGEFCSAKPLSQIPPENKHSPAESETIIPVSEKSLTRTRDSSPAPLFDELQYVAGDYIENNKKFEAYYTNLKNWAHSEYSDPQLIAIERYISKKTIVHDLLSEQILEENNGKLTVTKDVKQIIKRSKDEVIKTEKLFIRFRVEIGNSAVWLNENIRRNYLEYSKKYLAKSDICYVTGQYLPICGGWTAKIRNLGDRAKIISSNDKENFVFRGRFDKAEDAVSVSYEAVQKYSAALRWLIHKQGWKESGKDGTLTYVAWGTKDEMIPDLPIDYTFTEEAHTINKGLHGYSVQLNNSSNIVVMGLDSATDGRLSIIYYRELSGSDFLNRIEMWKKSARWHPLEIKKYNSETKKFESNSLSCPPPLKQIVECTIGREDLNKKLRRATIKRLIPCIIDGDSIPLDIMTHLANNASNPLGLKKWEYEQTLATACAIIRKYYNDKCQVSKNPNQNYNEVWKVELNDNENDRNYLFGRVLAYTRRIEEYVLSVRGLPSRPTNAERLMAYFRKQPMVAYERLYRKLQPYFRKIKTLSSSSLGRQYEVELNALIGRLNQIPNGFSNEPLSPLYLLGYQSQLTEFKKQKDERKKAKQNENTEKSNN